jgi:GNAT superfamily N-acetyltransferase
VTHYRLALPEDVPALRALVERGYRGDSARTGWTHEADLLSGERTSEAELARNVASADMRILLAERDGALIGTVTVTNLGANGGANGGANVGANGGANVGGGRAYLGMLCVDPAQQAAGLGRALIAQAERLAAQDFGARMMEMTVIDARPELIVWYERHGYVRTGELRPFPMDDAEPGPVEFRMAVLERAIG